MASRGTHLSCCGPPAGGNTSCWQAGSHNSVQRGQTTLRTLQNDHWLPHGRRWGRAWPAPPTHPFLPCMPRPYSLTQPHLPGSVRQYEARASMAVRAGRYSPRRWGEPHVSITLATCKEGSTAAGGLHMWQTCACPQGTLVGQPEGQDVQEAEGCACAPQTAASLRHQAAAQAAACNPLPSHLLATL